MKIAIPGIVFLMTTLMLSACGGGAETPSNVSPPVAVETPPTPPTSITPFPPSIPVVTPPVKAFSWALDALDSFYSTYDGKLTQSATGSNVNVYVIDSGVDFSQLPASAKGEQLFFTLDSVPDSWEKLGLAIDANACGYHGTAVASAIAGSKTGAARNVRVHSLQVHYCRADERITASRSDILWKAIRWVAQNGVSPAVVNISLGPDAARDVQMIINGFSAELKALEDKGIMVVFAAGNNGSDICSQTDVELAHVFRNNVLTVGALNKDGSLWHLSNKGACVDMFAPGESVDVIWRTGMTSSCVTTQSKQEESVVVCPSSGTSFAAPMVAATIALMLEKQPHLTPVEVRSFLSSSASTDAHGRARLQLPSFVR